MNLPKKLKKKLEAGGGVKEEEEEAEVAPRFDFRIQASSANLWAWVENEMDCVGGHFLVETWLIFVAAIATHFGG